MTWNVGKSCLRGIVASTCLATVALVSTAQFAAPAPPRAEPLASAEIGEKCDAAIESADRHLLQVDEPSADQVGPPPPPPVVLPDLPAASITVLDVVKTADELRAASTNLAQDIEIRAHLNLQDLTMLTNPDIPSDGAVSLLYARRVMRSVRGNCSDPDAATALGLTPAQAADLLPLKPRQCVILVPDTFLAIRGVAFWIDNVYLRLMRTRVLPDFSFLRVGRKKFSSASDNVDTSAAAELFVTNTTFHSELRGSAAGVTLKTAGSSLLLQDCIFTDWLGSQSPLIAIRGTLVNVVDTVFRDMRLSVELVDVSYNGVVRFQNASLANVTLLHGSLVSTTANDYVPNRAWAADFEYGPMDDVNYDVTLTEVPINEQSMFGEEFVIEEAVRSDCVFLKVPKDEILPGCPPESVQKRAAILRRTQQGSQPRAVDLLAEGYLEDYNTGDPAQRLNEHLLDNASPWLLAMREALGSLPPPPVDWNPFVVPPRSPEIRSDIVGASRPGLLLPRLRRTAAAVAAAEKAVDDRAMAAAEIREAGGGCGGDRMLAVVFAVVLVSAAAAVAATLWAVVTLRRLQRAQPESNAGAVAAEQQRRRGTDAIRVTPLVSDQGSHSWRAAASARAVDADKASASCDLVPLSAMNPAYEYMLPTDLAILMGTSIHKTEEEHGLDALTTEKSHKTAAVTKTARGCGGGRGVMPSFAATQHAAASAVWCLAQTECSHGGSGLESTSAHRSNTAPLGGAALSAAEGGLRDGLLNVWSDGDAPGGTIVVAPYDLTHSARSMLAMTSACAAYDAHTVGGTISRTASEDETRIVGNPPAAAEAKPGIHGIRMGSVDESDGVTQWTLAPAVDTRPTVSSVRMGNRRLRRLHRMLDSFQEEHLFLGRFELLGRGYRRRGGQAVVQFAKGGDSCDYAIKFFLDWDSFLTEAALYATAFPYIRSGVSADVLLRADATSRLDEGNGAIPMSQVVARFLPQVEAVCDGTAGGLEDPQGRPLPPCIVMEQGESLHDWSDRAEPDFFMSLAVLSNISMRLADMHDAGYAHRDLKPANVMWLPRANRWTVIDFGCVARIGEAAPLSFTLAYAAPEVVKAFLMQQGTIESTAALDAWSLGVMAFELLTGAPAYDLLADGVSRMMQRLRGDLPLPWEGELSLAVQRHLGMFKEPVLQLLERDPARRVSMRRFHIICTKLFAARTTVEA